MRTKIFLAGAAAAALMVGASYAQAPSGRDSSGAPGGGSQTQMNQSSPSSGSQMQQSPQLGEMTGQGAPDSRQGGQSGQMQQQSPQRQQGQTTGQGAPDSRQGGQSSQTQQQSPQRQQGQTSGQGAPDTRQGGQSGQMQRQDTQSGTTTQQQGTSTQQQGTSSQQGAQGQVGQSGAASANITTEQRTRIRETVLKSGDAPRVSRVDFNISVGTAVPRTVKVAPLPPTVVEIHPAWRGYMYFIVGDQIVVVEPDTHKIVAVIPA